MQKYSTVLDGVVVSPEVALPRNLTLPNGDVIANFDKSSLAVLIANGYYPLNSYMPPKEVYQSYNVLGHTVLEAEVTINVEILSLTLGQYKQQEVNKVYAAAKALLDAQAEGYSQVEIADWPAIQADVAAYNLDNTNVGAAMQVAADSSAYNVAGLAAMITPLIAYKVAVQADRKAQVVAIMAAATHSEV